MKINSSTKLIYFLALLTCSANAYSATNNIISGKDKASVEEQTSQNFFDSEIFSLSKKKENSFDAPSASYVLSSDDIRRSGATSIPEALRMVPGLQVARIDGNKWAISARGFNGQFSNKLLVMIDGRTVYTPVFSGVLWDLHDYVLEDIDRIEVVRGPGGTIWGANAVNGVINIITKNAAQTQGAYVSQIIGNQDKSITEARYGGKTASNDTYRLYYKKSVRDGLENYRTRAYNRDGNQQDRAGFRYDISSIQNSVISIHGDVFDGRAQNYFNTTLNNPDQNDKSSKGANLVVNWNKKLSKKSNFTLDAYFDYDQFRIPVLQRSAKTYDLDFQHFYNFSKENQFTWGLGYRNISDDIEESTANGTTPLNYTPNNMVSYIYSSFIQNKFGLIPDKLYLTVGSKFLYNNFTGFEHQPNAKLAYYPTRNQTIWWSVSRAVRTPTRNEDGLNLLGVQKGSTAMNSEKLIAYEMGYRVKPYYRLTIDIATFFNQYNQLRTFDRSSTGGFIAGNNGYGESYGFELATKWQATDDLKLEFDYDFLKTTLHLNNKSTDNYASNFAMQFAEGQSPQSQFKIKSFYNLTSKIEFDNIVYYVSGLPTSFSTSTASGLSVSPRGIPSYFRFDTRIGYLATKNVDLSIGIQDLLDQTHSEFRPGSLSSQTLIGRTVYGKVVWRY